jgi:hypothetical protein
MKDITKIQNILNNCIDCAGIDPDTVLSTLPKNCSSGFYVDVSIEDYREEDMMCLIGFLAQSIGMKNIWFDTYPKSRRVHLELNFDEDFLAR